VVVSADRARSPRWIRDEKPIGFCLDHSVKKMAAGWIEQPT
jgi:hypothetical protein